MDAFFASVALRERPDLVDQPVVVGGSGRGVVLAANYVARGYGIRSALPMARVRRLCPHVVVLAPDYATFAGVSASVMETFRDVTPVVEAMSLDEAFLDVRGATRRLGEPREIAERLRATIHDEQGITCSVGVAASVSVAKVASRRAKPDGVVVVPPAEVASFLHPLDVGELFGVGEKTRTVLRRAGLLTVGDVAHTPLPTLQQTLGRHLGRHLHQLAWGTDRSELSATPGPHEPERSMGADETFARDTADREVVVRELLRLSARVTGRMRAAGVVGRTITLRVRFADFTTITRSRTMPEVTDVTVEVHRAVTRLYDALRLRRERLRLVGVRVEGLVPRAMVQRQLVLGEPEHGWAEADRAVDRATRRFGAAAVRPASLV
ncbi:DNA polymerase IV [Nocardioides sp. zg-1228]|nr:DNA polymerase IV [Nocardioides sp. zg-1228]QSF59605.1 DNA polymerase IV [Nocardioides sp. zg-1228]